MRSRMPAAEPSTPPLEPVTAIQAAFRDAGVPAVVGGSAVLASLGLVDDVRDWDVVVDADATVVERVLGELGLPVERAEPHPGFASDALLRVDAGDHTVDVLVRFRIRTADGVVEIPAREGARWRGLVLSRPEDWRVAYAAMGRMDRAAALASSLRRARRASPSTSGTPG